MWYNGGMKRKWLFRILRCSLRLLIALLIGWGFYGFIKDDNWLAVSALATLILALGAFLAIWQNRSLQIRERRERLLNEIIEWAENVAKCWYNKEVIIKHDKFIGEHMDSLIYSVRATQTKIRILV